MPTHDKIAHVATLTDNPAAVTTGVGTVAGGIGSNKFKELYPITALRVWPRFSRRVGQRRTLVQHSLGGTAKRVIEDG